MNKHIDLTTKSKKELEALIDNYLKAGLEDQVQQVIAERVIRGGRVSAYKKMLKWNDDAIRLALGPFEDLSRKVLPNKRKAYAEAGGRVFKESYFKDKYTAVKHKWINVTFGCRIRSVSDEPEFVLIVSSGGERGETLFTHDQLSGSAIDTWAEFVEQAIDPLGVPYIDAKLVKHIANRLKPYVDGHTYSWQLDGAGLIGLGLNVPPITSGSVAQRTCALKAQIATRWTTASTTEKQRVVEWIVRDWGGISSNSKSTLARIAVRADAENPVTALSGIASLSKVLSFVRPDRFAIFDSRVAVALNALQMTSDLPSSSCIAFPYPSGRNTKLFGSAQAEGFVDRNPSKSLSDAGYLKITHEIAYDFYMETVRKVAAQLNCSMSQVEMALFAEAVNLAAEVDNLCSFNKNKKIVR